MKQFDNIIIFTDGACSGNGKKNAVAGSGVYFPNKEFEDKSFKFTLNPITNNRAELYAIYLALDTINTAKFNSATIYSDSTYAIKCVTIWYKKWSDNNFLTSQKKPIKNFDIIDKIHQILKKYDNIKIIYTQGHSTIESFNKTGNDNADKLAKEGKCT
jgi:ribonuclease HI